MVGPPELPLVGKLGSGHLILLEDDEAEFKRILR
jgi:hypothetical protein